MTTVLFRFFVGIWENHFGLANFFINLPLKLFNFNRSTHLLPILDIIIPPLPEGGGGILFYLCSSVRPSKIFFVTFFSATIDGRNLIFGHRLHIGIPYRGKRFWNHQIPTSCLPT